MTASKTYVSCLTPAGSGAIATIGLLGPNAWAIVEPLLNRRLPPSSDSFLLGRLGEVEQSGSSATDQVVVTALARAAGCGEVDIHCHGGVAVVRWIIELLCKRGAQEIGWEEWQRRNHSSPIQADAAIALSQASTLRTANILLDQYHGALERAFREIIDLIEAGSPSVTEKLADLAKWIPLGGHLTTPWRVVLAGAPNVGKSTLLNALVGYGRAITSPIPGTTRDVVTSITAMDGWPVELADTAGQRGDADGLEKQGIVKARELQAQADLCLWILDGSQAPVFPENPSADNLLPVVNKVDRASAWDFECTPWAMSSVVQVSGLKGNGVKELIQTIANRLIPFVPPAGTAVPFRSIHAEAIHRAQSQLQSNHHEQALVRLRELLSPELEEAIS